jgi:hypothetical protein
LESVSADGAQEGEAASGEVSLSPPSPPGRGVGGEGFWNPRLTNLQRAIGIEKTLTLALSRREREKEPGEEG